jgi:capsule polysaccharide export protein KpsE/RkpR
VVEDLQKEIKAKDELSQGTTSDKIAHFERLVQEKTVAAEEMASRLWSLESELSTQADRGKHQADRLAGSSRLSRPAARSGKLPARS